MLVFLNIFFYLKTWESLCFVFIWIPPNVNFCTPKNFSFISCLLIPERKIKHVLKCALLPGFFFPTLVNFAFLKIYLYECIYIYTLEKALGLHFISRMGLTCLWQLESHVEFTASNFDDAWQFFNIVRNPNITVSNRKRDLDSLFSFEWLF